MRMSANLQLTTKTAAITIEIASTRFFGLNDQNQRT